MAFLAVSAGAYRNSQAVTYAIKYITRTREGEDRRNELFAYGAIGASCNPEVAIEQYKIVQKSFRGRSIGKRVFHETLELNEEEVSLLNNDPRHMFSYANQCAYFYYNLGFQVVFAVHWDQKRKFHIHFVINPVCFWDGHKWHNTFESENVRKAQFTYCLMRYHYTYIKPMANIIQPISISQMERKISNTMIGKADRKYYVVARGKTCGIYEDYIDCQSQIENYSGALWVVCPSLIAAYNYLMQQLEIRDYYEIRIRGFRRWFPEYHSFLDFLNVLKDRYDFIFCDG